MRNVPLQITIAAWHEEFETRYYSKIIKMPLLFTIPCTEEGIANSSSALRNKIKVGSDIPQFPGKDI